MEDENYNSASDEDFNPTAEIDSPLPESEGFDSGDEVVVQELKKRRRKQKDGKDIDIDSGGEGGLIKTRAQRRQEQTERRPLAEIEGATIDVEAAWARLISTPPSPRKKDSGVIASRNARVPIEEPGEEEFITIKRTYEFAGETVTEERRVLKDSEEARLYLASNTDAKFPQEPSEPAKPLLFRPLKRPSRFEPNPSGEVKAPLFPPEKQLKWPRVGSLNPKLQSSLPTKRDKAQKLNTVEKSRYDWAGFVDKEGIAEELDEYGKAKESYTDRMQFLGRVEGRTENERRAARVK
ncbi:BCNT-domain-containing protein [Patellaria atrata CBS 101060]|uniref:SWR1-complex protein 5 n=1 Tax=Patellaria atrata CBS 101060 TaxID=1346257 RepID=A0A9P4VS98_9PEZI|nr:BCNT-domain-containing protein [Patellaria atrata CBS 101060]